MIHLILEDISFYARKCGIAGMLLHGGLHMLILYRVGYVLYKTGSRKLNPFWYLYLFLVNILRVIHKIELPETATIGRRLFLPHPWGLVMGPNTRIGDDCTIGPWVVLGHNGVPGEDPTIHNHVYIAPHACILGPIQVCSGAFIGANCVVRTSVQAGMTIRASQDS